MSAVELLKQALTDVGVNPRNELLAKFATYFQLLKEWNEKINLTSIVDEEEVYEKHFCDSLLPAKTLSFHGKTVLDIGSGGGFPGLVLALAFPDCQVTVLDATAKKFIFLKAVVKALELTNVTFVNARIEDRKVPVEGFDVTIARGFAYLPIFLECAAPYTKIGGVALAMKSAAYQEEVKAAKNASRLGLELVSTQIETLPNGGVRANLVYEKKAATPKKYPRRWDEIKREYR